MRTTLLYIVLVGTPLLGLLLILEAGGRIVPPRSIGGQWELDEATVRQAGSACPGLTFTEEPPAMRISQSGVRAELTFGDRAQTTLSVTLSGDTLRGLGRIAAAGGCPSATLFLDALLSGEEGRERLSGTLRPESCPACPAMPFAATRRMESSDR